MARTWRLAGLVGLSAVLLGGCEVARNARTDIDRLSSASFGTPRATRAPNAQSGRPAVAAATPATPRASSRVEPPTPDRPASDPPTPDQVESAAAPVNLVGQSESDIRARFGTPTSVEDRTPGKTWRYRRGQCVLDVSLYPDVQTRQFKTLAYEVRSDDNTAQGRRSCLGQLQSPG